MEAFENKHDLSPHEKMKRSSDDVDKIPETTTTSSDTNGDDVIEYTDGGVACKSKCEKNGQEYFWCWQITGSWDYCIPGKNILKVPASRVHPRCAYAHNCLEPTQGEVMKHCSKF